MARKDLDQIITEDAFYPAGADYLVNEFEAKLGQVQNVGVN
ncbi:hypothetical protein [Limosilactobacillus fermentum]|nr:hypothetical protein [Limosilactobacillus fermentum]